MTIIVEQATPLDIARLARIHHMALPTDFLPSLGRDFLEKVYYPSALKASSAATLTARENEQVVGFVTVAHNSSQFTHEVVGASWFWLALYALRAAFSRPGFLLKSMQVCVSALFSKPDPVQAEIVFIAVDPACHRQGIGTRLVISARDYLRGRGIQCCRTKTLAQNDAVIRMYTKMGWHVRDQFHLIGNDYVTIVVEDRDV